MVPDFTDYLPPTEEQIQQTIQKLQERLKAPGMKKPINRAIKEGYSETITILVEGRKDYTGIDNLKTTQGRAIAVLGVDYLNGECTQKVLVNVPLKA